MYSKHITTEAFSTESGPIATAWMLQMRIGTGYRNVDYLNVRTFSNEHVACITRDAYREDHDWKIDFRLISIS